MKRLTAAIFLGLLSSPVWADSCLSTDLAEPITWALSNTPGTPNYELDANGYYVSGNPSVTSAVPFSAVFWRRVDCPSQVIMTLDLQSPVLFFGSFTVQQNGLSSPINSMIVNDNTQYAANLFQLLLPPAPVDISGIVQVSNPQIDLSQAFTVQFDTATPTGPGPTITLGVPAAATQFAIVAGNTGNWYDAEQSGHGFSIEVLPGNQMLAEWYVFGPSGGRDWILGVGPYAGNTAVLTAWQVEGIGGKFPPYFVSGEVETQPWGTLIFTFTDCNNGLALWQPTAPGYTAGSMPISRLTMPLGLTCP